MTTDPTRAAEIVVRAEKAIALGKATGSDGSRLPSNIYVIAEELLALVQRPTDTARARAICYRDSLGRTKEARTADEVHEAWSTITEHSKVWPYAKRFLFRIGLTDERGNVVTADTPSPVTDETALSGEVERCIVQLERLSDWLLSNDLDMKLPEEIDADPRDIANWLRSKVWTERAAGQWHPGDEA
ncbi:hypothetical protein HRJ34_15345 [Rhizorhabdus wittichii]|uniref:Uncharacterized protein n=1 Tax=Rhizorhabdus wittichii TaxID=160791 RepID=A0A975CYP0_9SPHN|nr:hypothetical protein [Rhizorhabdus wittichii]QTH19743.1 hypothetical protein HRJ34_15345 [Rhizorhabdus wittichii]